MARGVNKVILIGNLGQDPELRYTQGGTAVCNMRLATSETYKDAQGELVEKTEWHSVVAWGRLAEICGEYLRKGRQVYFEGALQTRQWEDRDGHTRYSTEVKAREMQMLGSREDDDGGGQGRARPTPPRKPASPQQPRPGGDAGYDTFSPDDPLPF